jgi:hypothetical protein
LVADLTRGLLVIEFVEREDDMFQSLLALREDIYGDLTMQKFEAVFGRRFERLECRSLSGCRRHLFAFRKRP